MKYKLLFKSEDVSQKDSTDSGSVLHGLEFVRDWIENNEGELLEVQSHLRTVQKTFPPRPGKREDTVQNNWEWDPADSIDILSISPVDQGEDNLESFKIRGVVIHSDRVEFMAIPHIPMCAIVNKEALTAMEIAAIGYNGRAITMRQTLHDVMDNGQEEKCESIKTHIEVNNIAVSVQILNANDQIVGCVDLENYEGQLRIYIWETKDVNDEPTKVITPDICFDPLYEEDDPLTQIPGIPA